VQEYATQHENISHFQWTNAIANDCKRSNHVQTRDREKRNVIKINFRMLGDTGTILLFHAVGLDSGKGGICGCVLASLA
jgi:hypothetical protein